MNKWRDELESLNIYFECLVCQYYSGNDQHH